MLKVAGLLTLHGACIYFLWLLWKERKDPNKRGRVFTKLGNVSKAKSPRLFRFSIWVDFVMLSVLYAALIGYSVWLIFK